VPPPILSEREYRRQSVKRSTRKVFFTSKIIERYIMQCAICHKDLHSAEVASLLPIRKGKETVYACAHHVGVKEEYNKQNGIQE